MKQNKNSASNTVSNRETRKYNNKRELLFHKIKSLIGLALSLMIAICNGQETKPGIENNTPLISSSDKTDEINDPLFFIEGQLCQHLRKIFQDSKGNLWFGTNVYDLMLYDGDTLKYITENDAFSGGRVTGIVEDSLGNIWFATAFGINKYDGNSFTTFREEDGLANSEIWSLINDSKGIFWIGHNEGFSRFDGKEFTNFSVPKPQIEGANTIYSADRITGIAEDKEGNLWLGTDGYGICTFDGKSFTSYTTENGLADNTISDLMMDSRGNLWIGTFWGGLSKFDGEKFINFTKNEEISGVEISAFFEDRNGDIWIGAENNGVYKYDGDAFTHYDQKSFSDGSILSIYKDKENRFWFGGWGGLFRYDKGTFTPVTKDGPWK